MEVRNDLLLAVRENPKRIGLGKISKPRFYDILDRGENNRT